jgi:hypothetical protein
MKKFNAHNFDVFRFSLTDDTVKAIAVDPGEEPMIVTGELTISADVKVIINRGNNFYIEGTLINNGTIHVMGADSYTDDFINYSVMAVQNGGKVVNNGDIRLCSSVIGDSVDRGPVGGQLRILDGTFENNGSVYLEKGKINTHGGMVEVVGGTFDNNSLVVVDGFFLRVEEGGFTNNKGAVVINNSRIYAEKEEAFTTTEQYREQQSMNRVTLSNSTTRCSKPKSVWR